MAIAFAAFTYNSSTPLAKSHRLPGTVRHADPMERYFKTKLKKGTRVDSIVVVKHLRQMSVYHKNALLKIYRIALGDTPVGHKHFEGDEKTPEGLYVIFDKNPNSICHKNLGISYPSNADRAYAQKAGRPVGGDVKIHGLPNGQGYIGQAHLLDDWTNGCVAVTDEEIDELYAHTPVGIPINILP
jgi:murein L,D-transpeptidase YafK